MARTRDLPYAADDIVDGKYRVIRHIGSGGMGVVYEVEDTSVERHYVLKVLLPEFGSNKSVTARMVREAKALGKLRHKHIVEIFTAGATSGKHQLAYYVMERLSGHTLARILTKKGRLALQHAYSIVIDLLDALDYAHTKGVIHRDVKPDNIFIHTDGYSGLPVTKLLDFGIMTVLSSDTRNTGQGFVGTWAYAPPEQLRGDKVTPKSDVYAATLVLYECIAGRGPFDDEGAVMPFWPQVALDPPISEPPVPLPEPVAEAQAPVSIAPIRMVDSIAVTARVSPFEVTVPPPPPEEEPMPEPVRPASSRPAGDLAARKGTGGNCPSVERSSRTHLTRLVARFVRGAPVNRLPPKTVESR